MALALETLGSDQYVERRMTRFVQGRSAAMNREAELKNQELPPLTLKTIRPSGKLATIQASTANGEEDLAGRPEDALALAGNKKE